jgi:glycosyltransferase involved in cell wall biosynthesis
MTRVLVVSDAAEVWGTEHSLLNLAPHLTRCGIELTLAARRGGALEKRWRELGLPFVSLTLPDRGGGFRPKNGVGYRSWIDLVRLPFQTALAILRIVKVVREHRPEVIHSNSLVTHVDCVVAATLARTRSVLEVHDIVRPGPGRLIAGLAVRLSGTAIAISEAVRGQLPQWAKGRAEVVPQGVDTERFSDDVDPGQWRHTLTASPSAPLVAAVGRIDPEKGLHVLIKAVAKVRSRGVDVRLALVGSPGTNPGDYQAELTRLAKDAVGDACRIMPQHNDVPALLRSIDILACPSVAEPFGLILLEAQACGIPVVASASGGPPEFITHNETGLLVAPNDDDDLARALERLISDAALRSRIAQAGQTRVRRCYTVETRAMRIASIYRRASGA